MALAEQEDPWAEALAEQAALTEEQPADTAAKPAGTSVFKPLESKTQSDPPRDLDMILDIPVKLTVELGRTRLTIKQLLELAQGSVLELDGLAGEPMDILINGYLIAQGEVVVMDDKYGIRITEIVTPAERVKKLNR
ncbi:flagellar motor switch protein FliN [Zobellella maritima]|uniref:flagellar motor switch protein FliN n=1 Tax=Zobellella maritima TaxID=2059725 RepID=UPI001E2C952D|nr:flagellar motor switch protein FliN [Zobellella maritima]